MCRSFVLSARRLHTAAAVYPVARRRTPRCHADAGGARLAAASRAPNVLLIPGTSSVGHLRENVAAASLVLADDAVKKLDHTASIAA